MDDILASILALIILFSIAWTFFDIISYFSDKSICEEKFNVYQCSSATVWKPVQK